MSALSNLPALTRAYFTRANQPFGVNNTTQLIQEAHWTWRLAANLLDLVSDGTPSPSHARHANSVWICRGSSDGVAGGAVSAVGVAGTNRWNGGTFDAADFIRNANGSNHSWMLLENVNLSTEMLINFSGSAGSIAIQLGPTGLFTGGSVTTAPAPTAPTTRSLGLSQTVWEASQSGQYALFTDYANLGNQNYFHFTCADSGEFWVGGTRGGLGWFTTFFAFWKCVNGEPTDTVYNRFLITNSTEGASTPGAMTFGRLTTTASCASIQVSGVQKSAGGLVMPYAGNTAIPGLAVEAQTAKFISSGIPVIETSPSVLYRGVLPDLHMTGNSPPGTSIPLINQVRTQTGHLIVPYTDTAPNM